MGTAAAGGDPGRLSEGAGVLSAGVTAAEIRGDRLEPAHGLFMAARAEECRRCVSFQREDPLLAAFLRGVRFPRREITAIPRCWLSGVTVGYGKCSGAD